jgi:hypothetical protein
MLPSTSANRTPALSNRGIRYSRSSGSRMNRSHLKHSTASTIRASTSRIASSYPGRYFPGLVGSFRVTPMSLSESRYTTVQPRSAAFCSSLAIWLATPCSSCLSSRLIRT